MSGATFFADQVRAWSSPPVDDIGYICDDDRYCIATLGRA